MSEENKGLSRRRLLGGLAAVGIGSSAGAAGTYAYLSDSKNSELTLQSGSILLKIDPANFTFEQDDGDQMSKTVSISNKGTLEAKQLVLEGIGISGSGSQAASAAEVKAFSYRGNDFMPVVNGEVPDQNGNGIIDLEDLAAHLNNEPFHLEASTGGDGIDPFNKETVELVLAVEMDYSKIDKNGQQFTLSLQFSARQRSLEETDQANQTVWLDYQNSEPITNETTTNETTTNSTG